MEVSANDLICISGEIVEQQSGSWTARIEVDDEENAITGACTVKVGDVEFVGTVVKGEVPEGKGRWIGHVVGGKGGLEKELDAKAYFQATLRTIVQDALTACGETLDTPGTEAGILDRLVPHWSRTKGKARLALTAVAKKLGGFWRVTRGGQVVFRKAETWDEPDFAHEYIDADPSDGTLEIAPEDLPGARPGITLTLEKQEHKVAAVTTRWSAGGVRQLVYLADENGAARGLGAAFAAQIRKVTEGAIDYSRWYAARVVTQKPDGSLDVLPDDPRVRGTGFTSVPLLVGIPGLTVRVVPGGYVRLFFQEGDPSRPAVTLWEDGSSVLELHFASPQITLGPTAQPTQSAVLGELLMSYLDAVNAAVVTAVAAIPPSAAGAPNPGGAAAAAALTTTLNSLAAAKIAALSVGIKLQ